MCSDEAISHAEEATVAKSCSQSSASSQAEAGDLTVTLLDETNSGYNPLDPSLIEPSDEVLDTRPDFTSTVAGRQCVLF